MSGVWCRIWAVTATMPADAARRTALHAQGLARPRPREPATSRQVLAVVQRLGLLQIDSVNVFARAHLMPAYSRLGPYSPAVLDDAAGRHPRRLVEAWAHQASFVPVGTYRLLGWRHRAYRDEAWGIIRDVPLRHAAVVDDVRALLRERGPLTSAALHAELAAEHPRAPATDWGWNWTVAKRVVEFLFFTGEVTSAGRTASFERRYDLVERVLPRAVREAPEPSDQDAVRDLVARSAQALGVADVVGLADYFRLRRSRVEPAVRDLVDAGVLEPVLVAGLGRAFRHRDARTPRAARARALLSPFDPLVFERRRLEALFGLRYRIEIYTPAARRVFGYYVLPFLLGDRLPALVDLKADRADGVLRVAAAHRSVEARPEPPVPEPLLAEELAGELWRAAGWLGLGDVVVEPRGDLAAPLAAAVRRGPV